MRGCLKNQDETKRITSVRHSRSRQAAWPPARSTLAKPSESQASQGLRARRQGKKKPNITQPSSFILEWQSPLPSAQNVHPSSPLPHRHPGHHRLLLHGLNPRGWTAIMEPQQTIDYNSSFPPTSTSSTSDIRLLGEMGEGDG